ncbi:hypothetical protein PAHAL_1G264200 [Panicum hallii]|uniref:Multidrug resistance protein n=2 Tax=Panicum hallii TaxID=206008 RepID=A0A2S3GPY0_9POAL|nr:hypothetical protein PAHAL_1G264200 [Panicum hallii]
MAAEAATAAEKEAPPAPRSSFLSVFMHADAADVALMLLGLVGAMGDGMSFPATLLLFIRVTNDLGRGPNLVREFSSRINENARNLVFLACISWFMAFLEGYCWARTAERQASRMRARYLRAVLRQDMEYFDLRAGSTSEVVTSVSSDSLVVQDALAEKLPNFVMNATLFVSSYVFGFAVLWRLTLVALPSALLLVVPGIVYGRILTGIARRIREQYGRPGAIAEQAVSSARTVYASVAERSTVARFSAALEEPARLGVKQGLAKGVALGSNGLTFAIWAFNIWYGSRLVMYHGYPGGTVFAISSAIVNGGLALGSGLSNVKYFSEASAAAERILEVIRRVPKIDSGSDDGEELPNVTGEVEFRNVGFCYPSRPESLVLVRFSLRVPAGRTVALVGGSGSGKSTVVALLERFYDPSSGEVLLDGVDIRRLRVKWLRSQMGLVSQEPPLLATSILENIQFGKEDATVEEVIAAARAANAHDFITQLPQGYSTQVGERGVQMSGGQKQRIAIARSILKSPKILLLDEATSALDTESERIVQEALDLASTSRTAIVVAHRLSTIRNADMIAVMQSGEVKELGSHDELNAIENGLYTSLTRLEQQTRDLHEVDDEISRIGSSSIAAGQSSRHNMSRESSLVSRSSPGRLMGDVGNDESIVKQSSLPPVPSFRRLLMINIPEWKQMLIGSFSAVVLGAIQPVHAYGMGSMFSVYFLADHAEMKEKTRVYVLLFVALAVLSFLLNIGQHYSFGYMGEHLTKRIREQMLAKVLTFEIGWFDREENSTGAICSQLAKDSNAVRSLVGDRMALLVQAGSAVLIACTMGMVIAWRFALVMLAVQPLIIICFYTRRVLLKSMSKKSVEAQSQSSKLAAEAVSNVRTVIAFSSQACILRLFKQAQNGPRKESIRQAWFSGLGLGTSLALMTCSWALYFWYGGKLMAEHRISTKELMQTFMILVTTGRVIAEAGSTTTDLAKGSHAIASLFSILDRETEIDPDSPDGHKPEKIKGEVEILNIDFAYPSRPDAIIFRGFSLSIQRGKSTALIGQSGSGKSTIIGLIERFYDPLTGVVKIDGRDIKTYNLSALRRHIGLVSQEPTLIAGTIRENIVCGMEETSSEAEVEDAARSANAHEFISNLKDRYDTWCGERGFQLSGGQKQRVAIARAILKNPSILLLDEATSALDSQSENVVQEALDRVMIGRTTVVVAHRLTSIMNCDMIAVLDRGMIVEKGTHASLMAKGPSGAYFRLVRLQQGCN